MGANSYGTEPVPHTPASLADVLEKQYFPKPGVGGKQLYLSEYEWRMVIGALRHGPNYGIWIPVSERLPERSDWYGVLDAQGEKRAAMFHAKSGGWIHSVVEPIQAWCEFPPTATNSPVSPHNDDA